jgi:hypothetical protein
LQLFIFALSLVTNWYSVLSIALAGVVLVLILDKLGKGIVLREIIALHSCFICLVMPALGYEVYNIQNPLAKLWHRFMPVTYDVYFSFALPATAAFVIALCWPMNKAESSDHGSILTSTIERAKAVLLKPGMKKRGIYIVITGIVMLFLSPILPVSLQFFVMLFYFAAFAGILYVFYLPFFKYKWPIILLFALFILINSLKQGMFTIVAYMGMTMFSFVFLGSKTSFLKKALVFFIAGLVLMTIQAVKPQYRKFVWLQGYTGNKMVLFANLISDKVQSGEMFSETAFFPIYYRANQGFNVALVMRRIPSVQPFDNGRNLLISFASAFVPRFLWPDKPEAGGKFNMKFYAGIEIRGWSTNIGPLGEAYGSFGTVGGIIFMFVLGCFIRWAYARIFILAVKLPLLLFWIPVLFYQVTYSAESDTLQIFNSLFKSAFFVWLLYKIFPKLFGVINQQIERSSAVRPQQNFPNDTVTPAQ